MFTFCNGQALPGRLNQTLRGVTSREARSNRSAVKRLLLAMKLVAAIMLICSLHVTAKSVSQTITLSGKDLPLQTILTEIEKQSGYYVIYDKDVIITAAPVTVDAKEQPLLQFLDQVLQNKGFDYVIENKTIAVRRKEASLLEKLIEKIKPPIEVKGKVVDEKSIPLEGVTVSVKGKNKSVITNSNGEFEIKDVALDAILVISGVNIETREIKVNQPSLYKEGLLVIVTDVKVSSLNEVVVNKGYYTEKQRFSVGNVGHVSKEDIEKSAVQNPLLALQGRVPGIEIKQLTGMPGGGVQVRIQGRNSINSGLEPLIVVDGVPYPSTFGYDPSTSLETLIQGGSPLNYINPNDIESIDILKDADATAIYGSRAANGAIVISTKKGKAGKTKLSLNIQQGWGKVERKVNMMNTRQYLDMRYEALKNDGIDLKTLSPTNRTFSDLLFWDTTRYTDWQKELIGGTAQYTNVNAGISGGSSTIQYLFGATYNRQSTVFPGDFDDKAGNIHFSTKGVSTNQKFRLQFNGSYVYDLNRLPRVDLTTYAVLMEPNAPSLYKDDGSLNWAQNVSGRSTWTNPLAYARSSDFSAATKNLITNAVLSYDLLRGLEIRASLGYTNTQSDLYTAERLEIERPEFRSNFQRSASFGNRNMSSWVMEPQLNYSGSAGRKGKIEGLIATNIQKNSYHYLAIDASGFLSDQLMKTLRAATSSNIRSSGSSITRFNALFGRLGYNWDDRYLISITARRDGSNKFGSKNRFHNFGSIGVGWIFSQESLIKRNLPFISFGKLRASYGTTGNDQILDFSYLSIYDVSNPEILYQESIGLTARNIPNPHLQWEETRKSQAGIDLGFFKDRVNIGVTYAHNRSSNQLLGFTIPTTTGFTSITKNFPATIQNTSWEFTLNTVNVRNQEVSWSTYVNITIPRNKLIKFPGIEKTGYAKGDNGLVIGEPVGFTKVLRYGGVSPFNGNYLVMDKNNNPISRDPLPDDRVVFVSTQTQYYGGFSSAITYMGFQLDVMFQFVRTRGPRNLYFDNGFSTPGLFQTGYSNQPANVLDRWQNPGDISSFGRSSTYGINTIYNLSNAWYSFDASYVRLKNLSLSWQLPPTWIRQARIQNAKLFVHSQNLATITKYSGIDPESLTIATLPPLRMITAGAQIEF